MVEKERNQKVIDDNDGVKDEEESIVDEYYHDEWDTDFDEDEMWVDESEE